MRLIDADAAYERAQVDSRRGILEDWEFDMIVNLLDSAPTVDAAPVVHGEWCYFRESFSVRPHFRCSNCSRPRYEHYAVNEFRFCPNCGAKMDGGDPDGR